MIQYSYALCSNLNIILHNVQCSVSYNNNLSHRLESSSICAKTYSTLKWITNSLNKKLNSMRLYNAIHIQTMKWVEHVYQSLTSSEEFQYATMLHSVIAHTRTNNLHYFWSSKYLTNSIDVSLFRFERYL